MAQICRLSVAGNIIFISTGIDFYQKCKNKLAFSGAGRQGKDSCHKFTSNRMAPHSALCFGFQES